MQQLCDYKVCFKGQKQHIAQLLEAIAKGVRARNGDSWQYEAILSGLGGRSHYGLPNNFTALKDTDDARFISAVAFIQEESQVSKQQDFFRILFGLVPELESCAEVESGGSLDIEVIISPRDSVDIQISHCEYGDKPWYENIPASFSYQAVKLRGLDSTECSERIEFVKVGEVLNKKRVIAHDEEWRVGLFTSKGQVGYLSHDFSSVVMGAMESELGTDAAVITVSSVTPVSQRRKGSKYALLEVSIDFSKQAKDFVAYEKNYAYDPDCAILKNYVGNLPNIDDVAPEGLAFTNEPEKEFEFTGTITIHGEQGDEIIQFSGDSKKEEERKMYVTGVPQEGKRVELFDDLSIMLPYGAVYSKPEDGGCNIQMLSPIPSSYRDGSFSIVDDAPSAWKISFGSGLSIVDYTKTPISKAMESFQADMRNAADAVAGKNNKDTPSEDLSYSRTMESEDGYSYKHTVGVAMGKGDTSGLIVEHNIVICRTVMKIQVGRASIAYNWVLAGALDYPNATIYKGQLSVGDDDVEQVFSKEVVPVLRTLESPGSTPKTTEELAEIAKKRQEEQEKARELEAQIAKRNQEEKVKKENEQKQKEEERRIREQKEERSDEERVAREKDQLNKQRQEINTQLQTVNSKKEQRTTEIAEIDKQIAQAQTALKSLMLWKGKEKREINAQIDDLNNKKVAPLNAYKELESKKNSLTNRITDIDDKLSTTLTNKEKAQQEKTRREKLLIDSTPCFNANPSRGASDQLLVNSSLIASVLTNEPLTATEINGYLGTDLTTLQVLAAMNFIKGSYSKKVIRETVNAKGLKLQKEYTAYFIL